MTAAILVADCHHSAALRHDGSGNSVDHTFTSRWPYYGADTDYPYDLRTDTQSHLYYLFRKFVAEGSSEMTNREQSR